LCFILPMKAELPVLRRHPMPFGAEFQERGAEALGIRSTTIGHGGRSRFLPDLALVWIERISSYA
jgi:hypothetical protein